MTPFRLAQTSAAAEAILAKAARDRRHLIFDLDGTLVDSNAVCVTILQEMLAERGSTRQIDAVASRPLMSRGGVHMVAGLLADECRDAEADLVEFRARYMCYKTDVDTLFDGVLDGMAKLAAAGFAMAICSNKPQALCEKVLDDTGLAQFVSTTVGGRPDLKPKPAPDSLMAVLDLMGQPADRCIFIGDSDLDYRVARNADLPFAFMTYGYAEPGWRPETEQCWHSRAGQCFDRFDHLVATLHFGAGE